MSGTKAHTTTPLFAGFLQFNVHSGDMAQNLDRVRSGLAHISASSGQISPGMVVLPELWATGFAYEKIPELVKKIPELLQSLQELAAEHRVYLAGSLPEYVNGSYFNTLYITGPEGVAGTYRKQRLFSPMAEATFFTPGTEPRPVPTSLGTVAGLVCYDLRFPELLRCQVALGADILVISAQWPAARSDHWRLLIQARAVENQMFVIAANRCGTTDKTLFGGHSMIVGPDGTILLEAGKDEEFCGVRLDLHLLAEARALFRTAPEK